MDNKLQIETTVKSEKIYEGKIIKVKVDTVEIPGAMYAKREIVEHARGVVVVALSEEDEVYFVKQYRKPVEKFLLELPAGLVEAGENITEAATRELQEEIGYKPNKLELLAEAYVSPGFTDEKVSIFLASDLERSKLELDETEFLSVEKIKLENALEMIENFEIENAATIIGLLMLDKRRRDGSQ